MSVVNIVNLLVQINQKVSTSTDDLEILTLVKAIEKLKTGVVFTVPLFSNLPDAGENVGNLYFVEADGVLYFSAVSTYNNAGYWTPITDAISPLLTWGCNNLGTLGDGTTTSRCSPGTVAGSTTWCQVSGGNNHTAAIKTDGTLWTWGANSQGKLGDGTTTSRCSPGTVAGGGTTWCQVSNGTSHTAAIKTDGTLWTWGCNGQGRLGDGTTVSRCSPGTVAGGGTNWCQVSGGNSSTAAIKTNGTLWTWGYNNQGLLGNGTTTARCSPGTTAGCGTNWFKISIYSNMAAIKTDGTLWTWGSNSFGRLGNGTTVSRCSPGTTAGGGTNWCQVFVGCFHGAAIKTDGTLWTWGYNTQGRLGDGTTTSRLSPGTVAGAGTNWCQVSAGARHSAAIKTDGTLWTWGCNGQGRLGDGTTTQRCSPGTVAGGGTTWCQVSGGYSHTAAIQRETL